MTDTFTPAMSPSVAGSSTNVTPRVNRIAYDDGYSQRSLKGLNATRRKATIAWDALSQDDFEDIRDFFNDHAGNIFFYQMPGDDTSRKWECTAWSWSYLGGIYYSMTAEISEEFDP